MAVHFNDGASKIEDVAKEVSETLSDQGISSVLWNQAAMDVYGYASEDPAFDIKTVDLIVSDRYFHMAKEILAKASGGSCEKTTPIDLDLGHSDAHFLWKPPRTEDSEERILVGLVRQRRVLWGMGLLEDTLKAGNPVSFENQEFVSAENPIFPNRIRNPVFPNRIRNPNPQSGAPDIPVGHGGYSFAVCQVYIMRPWLYAKTLILCAVRNYEGDNHVPIEANILKKMGGCLDRYNVVRDLPSPYNELYTQLRDSPSSPAATAAWVQGACRALAWSPDLGQ
ncbi:unnamed protein product [Clonostachys rhizophaga]|uniref:Uncharacterized protein n=1 Tax=Clonostachys rhizophaga TaxID=160324 RepID=A0A9N9V525_9HYPO|nr:unnamed protein product [Clonostachys rhizophaga]